MKRYTSKVTFSTTERHFSELERRAKGTEKTPHQVARDILEGQLDRNDDALRDALNILAKTVVRIGEELGVRIEQLAEIQMEQGRELTRLKQSLRSDLENLAEAISGKR